LSEKQELDELWRVELSKIFATVLKHGLTTLKSTTKSLTAARSDRGDSGANWSAIGKSIDCRRNAENDPARNSGQSSPNLTSVKKKTLIMWFTEKAASQGPMKSPNRHLTTRLYC